VLFRSLHVQHPPPLGTESEVFNLDFSPRRPVTLTERVPVLLILTPDVHLRVPRDRYEDILQSRSCVSNMPIPEAVQMSAQLQPSLNSSARVQPMTLRNTIVQPRAIPSGPPYEVDRENFAPATKRCPSESWGGGEPVLGLLPFLILEIIAPADL
jgi:hypothetical protein